MPETILIIDDTETNRYAFSRLLGKAGYTTLQAANLKDGMTLLTSNPVNLVLLDVNLPDGTGFDMCVRIKGMSEARLDAGADDFGPVHRGPRPRPGAGLRRRRLFDDADRRAQN